MSVTTSPVTADEVAATRLPVDHASLLPPRVFHDPEIFAYEQLHWFGTTWLCVGREAELSRAGTYLLARVAEESVIVLRDTSGTLRAFNNVCRHRGSTLLDEPIGPTGSVVRIQCPYHAWIYDLDGSLRRAPHTERLYDFETADHGLNPVRIETWHGFIFINLAVDGPTLTDQLADFPTVMPAHLQTDLRSARRIEYEVAANWKVIAENYSECYHCPGVHPQLNRLSPYDRGRNLESRGPWAGSWMELGNDALTMSTDGGNRGRPQLRGISAEDLGRIYYFVVWPNLLLSLHPDYVMTHQVWPVDAEHSRVVCEWFFEPATIAMPGFDPSDAVDFWDLTNRQDWAVCERQQEGTRSRAYRPGRYSMMEDMVHAFDLMVADRYADDGLITRFPPRNDKWSDRQSKEDGSPAG